MVTVPTRLATACVGAVGHGRSRVMVARAATIPDCGSAPCSAMAHRHCVPVTVRGHKPVVVRTAISESASSIRRRVELLRGAVARSAAVEGGRRSGRGRRPRVGGVFTGHSKPGAARSAPLPSHCRRVRGRLRGWRSESLNIRITGSSYPGHPALPRAACYTLPESHCLECSVSTPRWCKLS